MNQLRVAPVAAEGDMVFENPRYDLCANHRATLVRGNSVTEQCPAATAWLTREYQADHRRRKPNLTPAASRATRSSPLDFSFHISSDTSSSLQATSKAPSVPSVPMN